MTKPKPETATPRADDELIELEAPPAPPVLHNEEQPAGGAERRETPPAPPTDRNEDANATADETDPFEELELEPERHPSSAGFGVTAKFTGAVADAEAGGYHHRWQDAREATGEPRTLEADQ